MTCKAPSFLRCSRRIHAALMLAAAFAICTWVPGRGNANTIIFNANGTGPDGSLNATAQFMTGAGTLSILLTNNQTDTRASGQAISGIEFTLSTTPTGTVTGAGASGQLIDIAPGSAGGGVVTPTSGNPDRWLASGHITQTGATVELLVLGGGKPSEMILGPPSASGNYDNMNQGTAKNFSPWVQGSGLFNLNIPGIGGGTTISAVTFLFGTGPDSSLPGVAIPEPTTWSLATAGLMSVSLVGVLRTRHRSFFDKHPPLFG